MTATKLPADCETKDDVRAEIDRIDHALIELFAKRRAQALKLDLDEDQIELLWRTLIDWNVNYEKGIIIARTRKK